MAGVPSIREIAIHTFMCVPIQSNESSWQKHCHYSWGIWVWFAIIFAGYHQARRWYFLEAFPYSFLFLCCCIIINLPLLFMMRATTLFSMHYNRALVPLEPTIKIPEVPIIADNNAMSGFNLNGLQIWLDWHVLVQWLDSSRYVCINIWRFLSRRSGTRRLDRSVWWGQ